MVVIVHIFLRVLFLVGKSFRSFLLLIAVDMFIIRTWCAWTTSNAALALRMDLHVTINVNVGAVHFTCIFIWIWIWIVCIKYSDGIVNNVFCLEIMYDPLMFLCHQIIAQYFNTTRSVPGLRTHCCECDGRLGRLGFG